MTNLFVDTSALYALADGDDHHHHEARSALGTSVGATSLVMTDHVVVESWLLIASRLGRRAAMRFWDGLAVEVFTIVGVTAEDLRRGREIAREWPDQSFSIVDCTSFALIERLDIGRACAFDAHFRIFRLGPRRNRALEIIPH